jgi:hypothetical protein
MLIFAHKVLRCGIAAACALAVSCGPKLAGFTAVMSPSKTTAVTRDRITVAIECSQDIIMKTKLTVTNRSRESVVIGPGDIALRIDRAGIVLQVQEDYKSYVAMRYASAIQECGRGEKTSRCKRTVEELFQPFTDAKPFAFGIIMPGAIKSGYIAFNLPDPFNRTEEAQLLADSLKSMMNLLDGIIEITASALSKDRQFVFPVNITAHSNADRYPLTSMR